VFRIFQMDLSAKFKMISYQQIKITSLRDNTPYPIEWAEKVQTKYGEAMVLTLQESPDICESVSTQTLLVSIHRWRLHSLNVKSVSLSLKYIGTDPTLNSYILEIE